MANYRWLLFDADDTLFDYGQAEAGALRRTFEQSGVCFDAAYLGIYQRINHQLWLDFEQGKIASELLRTRRFELLFEAIGVLIDASVFSPRYLSNLAASSELIEGALEIVQALHGRYRLAIITNGLRDVQRPRLAGSAIRDYIEHIIISEEVGAVKPEPAIFDAAFRLMGWPGKDQVLMIGDSLTSDMAGGSAYGIDTCWFNPRGLPRPAHVSITHEIKRLDELVEMLA
jgi:2-haloacid dehalogenase